MRQDFGQFGQFVIVSSEKGFGPQPGMVVDVLDDGPGNRDAVVGAGSTTDLIKDEQAASTGVIEDVGRLHHLHHKGALTSADLVLSTDASEDTVHQPDPGLVSRDERADLSHEHDKGYLA